MVGVARSGLLAPRAHELSAFGPSATTQPGRGEQITDVRAWPVGRASPASFAGWAFAAGFGTYFCMYGFRKPFTAAAFAGSPVWGIDQKTLLVSAQVLGYALAKCVGVRVIAEMPPNRRAIGIVVLIALAELALLLFGLLPRPIRPVCKFVNGLSLGMVFGLVVGFLEGRRITEALTAGLCASFILADGLTKSAGTFLLELGIAERWMPAMAGLLFLGPLLAFVWMLSRIPPPDPIDIALRSERRAMSAADRVAVVSGYGLGLFFIIGAYFFVSLVRGIRADFALEIWRAADGVPAGDHRGIAAR
jgi:Family of unknown function (DUF5690)